MIFFFFFGFRSLSSVIFEYSGKTGVFLISDLERSISFSHTEDALGKRNSEFLVELFEFGYIHVQKRRNALAAETLKAVSRCRRLHSHRFDHVETCRSPRVCRLISSP